MEIGWAEGAGCDRFCDRGGGGRSPSPPSNSAIARGMGPGPVRTGRATACGTCTCTTARKAVYSWTSSRSHETVYVITDLTSRQASPKRIARLIRSQWVIENRLHFIRDVTFDEDRPQVRTGPGPKNMATLHNLAINKLREHGHTNGPRERSYQPFTRPLDPLNVTPRDQQLHQDQRTLKRPCRRWGAPRT
ncbi:transposase [Streptomyces sp. NPDC048419]|uniref:transposase n=1 Tax=Streptomyces sp. NPDC048419 TaxID=3365547 RepID=UPI003713BD7B